MGGDWDRTTRNSVTLRSANYVQQSAPTNGDADISCQVYAAWDVDSLYFLVDVEDNTHISTETGTLMWTGDSLQVALDVDDDGDDNAYFQEDFEFGVTQVSGATYLARWSPQPELTGTETGFEADTRRNPTPNKTVYELRIPFSTLGMATPTPGTALGFSFIVNDDDAYDDSGGEREGWVEFTEGIGWSKAPSAYGSLVFAN